MRIAVFLLTFMVCAAHSFEAAPRIIDGTPTLSSNFPAVALLKISDPNGDCTGTLISPSQVLTAAHCLFDLNQQIAITTSSRVEINGFDYAVSSYVIHPAYAGSDFDVAILNLANSVAGVDPVPIYRGPPVIGMPIQIVGYGEQGTGQNGTDGTFPGPGVVNFGDTFIEAIDAVSFSWRFDPGESNTAGGDSGGPAFVYLNQRPYLIGVTSDGDGGGVSAWGEISSDVRVDAVADFIDIQCGYTNLTSSDSSVPVSTRAGTLIPISTTVLNEGYRDAAPFHVRYRLSADQQYDGTDILLGEFAFTGGLLARTFDEAPVTVECPTVPPGLYYVVWQIDPDDAVYQSDLSDDEFSLPITVVPNGIPGFLSAPTANPNPAIVANIVIFSAVPFDPEDDSVLVSWEFGDGSEAIGNEVEHIYSASGDYTGSVTVTDSLGATSSFPFTIKVDSLFALFAPEPLTPVIGGVTDFRVALTDPLALVEWTFDGTDVLLGANVNYAFFEEGIHTVNVFVKSGQVEDEFTFTITVLPGFGGIVSGESATVVASKCKFSLNFANNLDSFNFTLRHEEGFGYDKEDFLRAVNGKAVQVAIDLFLIDTLTMVGKKGSGGKGKLTWNHNKATIKYSLKKQSLQGILVPLGAVDADTFATVPVPISLIIDEVEFTATPQFRYVGKVGKSGTGKAP